MRILLLLILLLGIVVGVYLVQKQQIFKSKANSLQSIQSASKTTYTLAFHPPTYSTGDSIAVKLLVRSESEPTNLFAAYLNFPPDLLSVEKIDTKDSFIKMWVSQYQDNNKGIITIIGGVPNPGFKNTKKDEDVLMATIYFKSKNKGVANVSFTDKSAIYSNSTNKNILTLKKNANINIISKSGNTN